MAELIDKGALYNKVAELEEMARNRVLDTPTNSPCYMRYVSQMNERTELKHLIADTPTVTEAEIRNKAIDEFAEKLKDKSTFLKSLQNDYYGYVCEEEIDEIAEQLKGGNDYEV